MSDFFQNGAITTLHRLGDAPVEHLEEALVASTRRRPLALVLPCLYSELRRPALRQILRTIRRVPYLDQVVIALGRANEEQFRHAQEYFARLQTDDRVVRVLWNEGPRMQRVYRLLEKQGIPFASSGKGRAMWAANGYILAAGHAKAIVAHDSDILTYERDLLARLAFPVADPDTRIAFCKGYYARTSDRLNGRVTRLFLTPLVRTLRDMTGDPPFLRYLDSYRYALAGEFAMDVDLARRVRVPADWGLEIGMLAEVYRRAQMSQIAQVDIADAYDHKHQELTKGGPRTGLQKMAIDVAQSLLRTLENEGVTLDERLLLRTQQAYPRVAADFIERYAIEARLNGLHFHRDDEERGVRAFTEALAVAARRFLRDPRGAPWIPSWEQVTAEVPECLDVFYETVEADNARVLAPIMPRA
jgi:glucosyl-3-phosphoglycerate synthase